MEQWEYLTRFMEASAREPEIRDYIKDTFDKKPRRHSPEAMIPELNRLGNEGWELVHMEPVAGVGGKEDVRFDNSSWSSAYFCVFKRRKSGSYMPVLPLNAAGKPAYPGEQRTPEPPRTAPRPAQPKPEPAPTPPAATHNNAQMAAQHGANPATTPPSQPAPAPQQRGESGPLPPDM